MQWVFLNLKTNRYGILLPKLFWPTVKKIVLVIKKNWEFQNCSSDQEKLRIPKNFEITIESWSKKTARPSASNFQIFWDHNLSKQWKFSTIFKAEFIHTVKGQNAFLTYSWRCLRSNRLEQLEFKLEKIIMV